MHASKNVDISFSVRWTNGLRPDLTNWIMDNVGMLVNSFIS